VHCCRIITRLIVGRHALTQALEVGAFLFVEFFDHRHRLYAFVFLVDDIQSGNLPAKNCKIVSHSGSYSCVVGWDWV
jgi:hypothetical protein